MYDNIFPARFLGNILREKRCECGVEDFTEGDDLVGDGNDATPTTKHEKFLSSKQLKLLFNQMNMLTSRK